MNRNSLLEMSGRIMHVVQRFTLNQGNDNPMMQELHLDGMVSEFRGAIERIQHFGFTSTPLPRDEQQSQGSGNGAGGNGLANIKGPAAEGICLMVGGQRNHPVCIAIDDRRHRPMGLKPGENAQYDDLGQMTLLRRTGLYLLSSDDVQPQQSSGGGSQQQQQQARMASLRHVQKPKQPRPSDQQQSAGSGSTASTVGAIARAAGATTTAQSNPQNFMHEGETVNTEVRVTKTDIQILDGTTVVGRYDKASGTWTFTSKTITLHASSAMTVQCDARLDIKGNPIVFNNGTPSTPPFQVPGS
jgi:phage gp45-like